MLDLKCQARQIFHQTLQEVDVRLAVSRNVSIEDSRLLAGGASFNLDEFQNLLIIAIGKAATPMYEAAIHAIESTPSLRQRVEAIVVAPERPSGPHQNLTFYPGSHPTPDEISRQAATAILRRLHLADAQTVVLFLISGGSSSMVELPLDPAISIADIADFNRTLVESGLPITKINVLRKHLSAIKGGRLAAAAAPAAQCTLILSDVPANSFEMVGSGPSMPDSSSREDCQDIYRRLRSIHRRPERIERFFELGSPSDTVKSTDPAFRRAVWTSILSSDHLAAAAAAIATESGFHVQIDNSCDEWSSGDAAHYLLDRSAQMRKQQGKTCLISVGELAVAVKKMGGQGGRNQHFALECAIELAERDNSTVVLSAGSDGIDGNSPAAGAVADEKTCERAILRGIDPMQHLAEFDSFNLFQNLGDAIMTGVTGNNLRDLRFLLT